MNKFSRRKRDSADVRDEDLPTTKSRERKCARVRSILRVKTHSENHFSFGKRDRKSGGIIPKLFLYVWKYPLFKVKYFTPEYLCITLAHS